ncbi:MAG: hypothetical protein KTR14_03170 [Vampirovibrio sp.]|nr:hypothetical protein [Vampirovibrio sp.]
MSLFTRCGDFLNKSMTGNQIMVTTGLMVTRPIVMMTDVNVPFGTRLYAATREFFTELFGVTMVMTGAKAIEYAWTVRDHDKTFKDHAYGKKLLGHLAKFQFKEAATVYRHSTALLVKFSKGAWQNEKAAHKVLENWTAEIADKLKENGLSAKDKLTQEHLASRIKGIANHPELVKMLPKLHHIGVTHAVFGWLGVVATLGIVTPLLNNKVINESVLNGISSRLNKISVALTGKELEGAVGSKGTNHPHFEVGGGTAPTTPKQPQATATRLYTAAPPVQGTVSPYYSSPAIQRQQAYRPMPQYSNYMYSPMALNT